MNRPKRLWLTMLALTACAACCAIPLYTLLIGTTGLAVIWSDTATEIVKCLIPLALLGAGYWFYRKHQAKKNCCASPQEDCNNQQCAIKQDN